MKSGIILKKFETGNIENTFLWVSQEEFKKTFLLRGEITKEGNLNYFSKILNDESQIVFAIYADEKHVGNCGLKNIDKKNKEAELWIYIGDVNSRGKGWGKIALLSLLNFGFSKLGFLKISLHVAASNNVAINLYLRYGFVELDEKNIDKQWEERGFEIKKMELSRANFLKT
nr:GNAT family N-acetyltransferase [uncultured Acetobacterium sp.]